MILFLSITFWKLDNLNECFFKYGYYMYNNNQCTIELTEQSKQSIGLV